jgi:hypothetical protein
VPLRVTVTVPLPVTDQLTVAEPLPEGAPLLVPETD